MKWAVGSFRPVNRMCFLILFVQKSFQPPPHLGYVPVRNSSDARSYFSAYYFLSFHRAKGCSCIQWIRFICRGTWEAMGIDRMIARKCVSSAMRSRAATETHKRRRGFPFLYHYDDLYSSPSSAKNRINTDGSLVSLWGPAITLILAECSRLGKQVGHCNARCACYRRW
jgi:hypothetical protein